MSTYLDFYCKDCNVECGLHDVHARLYHDEMVATLAHRHSIAAFQDIARFLLGQFWPLPEFFAQHAGHDVVLANGYGQTFDAKKKTWSASRYR
jgi:hypothetical protein